MFADDFRDVLVFHLFPESIGSSSSVEWDTTATGNNKLPIVEYKGVGASIIAMRLLFNDVGHPHDTQMSTYLALDWLERAKQPEHRTGEPPTLLFIWGSQRLTRRVVIESFETEEVLIDPESGLPLRAFVDLTLLVVPARRVEQSVTQAGRPRRPLPPPVRGATK